ncbi:response regulator [Agrobacterium vitis]|uniref:histidine kinase n=1 Tax=Agrobacterium vitis TaxID=373 RepID=A0A120DCR7_AGRVI|nr:response regulator [Agrobacterium vitis]MCF1501844.1 response regulator [Allorhizobium sp. Av2]KAA3506411.1 response regulator [Agrobacterium vitis]KAA3520782.1 response regulator [Agrobacterium vitis]MBF2714190.1 response regulator [Agrobacterium vitis]MCM2443489.1 response regulator [Agrobacterium vitis]
MEPVPFLLVDDLEENLLSLEALLRRNDLLILKAKSGDQALEILLHNDVALALVDVQMPGLNGFELAELMRGNERTRRIPIIFVTAGTTDAHRRFRGYEAGAVDFIQKPIEPDILRSKVDVFFELYRQRQQLAAQRDELVKHAQALKDAAGHKDILLREINHRIKNLFSLAAGLISLSARPATSVAELETDLRSRMHALARAHELTLPDFETGNDGGQIATTVTALLKAIVAPHDHAEGSRITITGSDAPLTGTALTSLALLLHELTTNAAKYGALSTSEGRLTIDVTAAEELLHLRWDERGSPPPPEVSTRAGFGTTLEKAALQGLNGAISRDWTSEGLSLTLEIPLESLVKT